MAEPLISVIVPALDEENGIAAMLEALQAVRRDGHEVIVVDGGSRDRTRRIAGIYADRVLTAPPGRAVQMNRGARVARGGLLWFLHADTLVGPGAVEKLEETLRSDQPRSWGRFDVTIDSTHPALRVVALLMNVRSRVTGIATGDQGIFVSRSAFEAVGGYPEQPLMEDIALSRRLKQYGPPVCLSPRIRTSGRRWEQNGVFRTILSMWWLRLAYFCGVRPDKLAARYNRGGA